MTPTHFSKYGALFIFVDSFYQDQYHSFKIKAHFYQDQLLDHDFLSFFVVFFVIAELTFIFCYRVLEGV